MWWPGAVLVLFERVPIADTCCLWFEVVESRIGCAGLFVSRLAATLAWVKSGQASPDNFPCCRNGTAQAWCSYQPTLTER